MAFNKGIDLLVDCLICGHSRTGRNPRGLDYKHCFCFQCLTTARSLLNKQTIQCPVCWKTTLLPSGGLAGLPADKNIDEALQILAGSDGLMSCKACLIKGKASQAHARCGTCDRILCDECTKKHLKRKPFSDHLIVTNLCKVHISDYTHVCLTCQSGLCLDCIESELHDDHDVCDVTEVTTIVAGVLSTGKNIIQNKIHELDKMITVNTDKALDKLNKRRRETEEKLELYKRQLHEAVTDSLDKREEVYHKAVASALEKQNQASSEASNVVNEIENLTRDSKMNIISNLSTKTAEMYKALDDLTSAPSSLLACPEIGEDICTATEDRERGKFEFSCTLGAVVTKSNKDITMKATESSNTEDIGNGNLEFQCNLGTVADKAGGVVPVCSVDYKSKPTKQLDVRTIYGEQVSWHCSIKPGPDSTVIVGDLHKTQATRINTSGEVVARYRTADGGGVRGVAVSNSTVHVLSLSGKTVAAHTGGQVHVIKLRPQVQEPIDMNTNGVSLLVVQHNQKLLRYSYQGELLQQFQSPGIYAVTCAVHPDTGPVYLVTDIINKMIRVLRHDGGSVMSFGGRGLDDGQFTSPRSTTMLPNGNILVADWGLHRVSEFTFDGAFIRHLLTREDGLSSPFSLSVSPPYLWVGCAGSLCLYKYVL